MIEELITQCPKCHTSFKVTDEHLKIADGLVRCGSCLHVFNALEYSALNQESSTPPQLEQEDSALIDDLFDQDTISHLDKNVDITDDSVNEFISSDQPKPSLDDNDIEEELLSISDDDDDADPDELFGGESITDPEPVKHQQRIEQDDDWADQLLQQLDSSSLEEPEDTPDATSQTKANPTRSSSDTFEASDFSAIDNDLVGLQDNIRDSHSEKPYIETEPVYLATEPENEKKDWLGLVGWSTACLIACLCILLQIAWLNFNQWSKLPELRTSYTWGCAILGCKLPNIQATEQIRASNLIVRSDKKNSKHLIIDAIISNQASFTQPYPKLALVFTDATGKVIASGLIHPNQYLGGELAGAIIMEKDIPIHISFKINDPGANARSYRLELYP